MTEYMDHDRERMMVIGHWCLAVALVALWGYLFAVTAIDLLKGSLTGTPRLAVVKKSVAEREKTRTLDDYIASTRSLFHEPSPEKTTGRMHGKMAPATREPMDLVATVIGDGTSLAVIRVAGNDEVVSTGQMLGGSRVKSIFKNQVILENGSQQSVLSMKFGNHRETALSQGPPMETRSEPAFIKGEFSRREFCALVEDPVLANSEARFSPWNKESRPYGIKLMSIKKGGFFQAIGCQPGDVLVSINRESLYTPEQAIKAYMAIKNEDMVNFTVDRDGKMLQLQVEFR